MTKYTRTFELTRYLSLKLPVRRVVLDLPLKAPKTVRSDNVSECATAALLQSFEAQRAADEAYEKLDQIERDVRAAKALVGRSFTHAQHIRYCWPDVPRVSNGQAERGND